MSETYTEMFVIACENLTDQEVKSETEELDGVEDVSIHERSKEGEIRAEISYNTYETDRTALAIRMEEEIQGIDNVFSG